MSVLKQIQQPVLDHGANTFCKNTNEGNWSEATQVVKVSTFLWIGVILMSAQYLGAMRRRFRESRSTRDELGHILICDPVHPPLHVS